MMTAGQIAMTAAAAWVVAAIGWRWCRRSLERRDAQILAGLISEKRARPRFKGFDPGLRDRTARRRAEADEVRRQAQHAESGGATAARVSRLTRRA